MISLILSDNLSDLSGMSPKLRGHLHIKILYVNIRSTFQNTFSFEHLPSLDFTEKTDHL